MPAFLIAAKLLLGGWLKAALSAVSSFFRALNSQGWIGLILCGLLAFLYVRAEGESRHWHKQSDRYEKLYSIEHSGRLADRQAYSDAQAKAANANKAQVAKVEQQYQRNSEDERQSYLSDLARLRGMRGQNPAVKGAAGATIAPAPSTGASGIDAARLCIPAESALCEAGAEIELRLMHLQNLYDQQSKVDPNGH